jgi:hypothetical protein
VVQEHEVDDCDAEVSLEIWDDFGRDTCDTEGGDYGSMRRNGCDGASEGANVPLITVTTLDRPACSMMVLHAKARDSSDSIE